MSLRPTIRLVGLGAVPLVLALATAVHPGFGTGSALAGTLIAVAGLLDALLPGWRTPPEMERKLSRRWPVGHPQTVVLRITTGAARSAPITLIDDAPPIGPTTGNEFRIQLEPDRWSEHGYTLVPQQRGVAQFGPAEVLLTSRLGLWELRRTCGTAESVQVVPDHGPALRRTLQTLAYRVSPRGSRRRPRRGQGTSFHQLREYRDGDLPQQIDWKATAKRRQLVSREYEEERDQRVFLALDRGRRMRAHDGPRTLFDRALDATLVLAYIALRQGDSVGLVGFSGPIEALPSVKGPKGLPLLFGHVQGWQPNDSPSDFAEAAHNVLTRESRRTMLILITNLRGEDADELARAVHSLRRRHLVVVASMREASVDAQLHGSADDFDAARDSAAAALVLEDRRQAIDAIQRAGALTLDTTAADLPTALSEVYLDAKRGGLL